MAGRELTIVRLVVVLILAALAAAVITGYPETCNTFGAATLPGSCKPVSLSHWWHSGAQVSKAEIHGSLFGRGFFNSDFVSSGFAHATEWFADRGRQMWNPLAENAIVRVVVGALAVAFIYDLLKAGFKALFRTDRTGGDPPKPQAGEPAGS